MQYKTVPDWVREARIEHFEANLAIVDPIKAMNHCIDRLAEWEDIYDELRTDIIPKKLNYEEVIGALLLGRNAIQEQQYDDEWSEYPHVKESLAKQERERQYDK